jgi:uncharacterized phage protein (TIGR02218 family)
MKSAPGPLVTLLNSGTDFQTADLWTITLNGGSVIRWSGEDKELVANGNTFALGPAIERGAISEKVGLEVATLTMKIIADGADLINGTPLIPFIRKRGLDGANVKLEKAFLPDWTQPVTGTVLRFSGRVTSVGPISGSTVEVTVSSWAILLNVNMPANLYQSACMHSVYDAGCALNANDFDVSSTVTSSPAPTLTSFDSGLSTTANDFAQGYVIFTSGANSGVRATVKSNDGSGGFVLVRPLPSVPAAGDAFTAYPGCDLTRGRCSTRFNNLGRHKATPFVPVPETVFG